MYDFFVLWSFLVQKVNYINTQTYNNISLLTDLDTPQNQIQNRNHNTSNAILISVKQTCIMQTGIIQLRKPAKQLFPATPSHRKQIHHYAPNHLATFPLLSPLRALNLPPQYSKQKQEEASLGTISPPVKGSTRHSTFPSLEWLQMSKNSHLEGVTNQSFYGDVKRRPRSVILHHLNSTLLTPPPRSDTLHDRKLTLWH